MSTNNYSDELGWFIVHLRGICAFTNMSNLASELNNWPEMCPTFTRCCIWRACGVIMVLSAVRHRNLRLLAVIGWLQEVKLSSNKHGVRFTEVVTCAATGGGICLFLMTWVNVISKPRALYIQNRTNTERKPSHEDSEPSKVKCTDLCMWVNDTFGLKI